MSISNLTEGLNEILRQKNEYITPENIKKDVQVFNITGSYEGINTSDANATASDILKDKTAYVNGSKIVGTLNIQAPTGNVKLFSTIEEMNSSSGNEDGDIGVVYKAGTKPTRDITENDSLFNALLINNEAIPDDGTFGSQEVYFYYLADVGDPEDYENMQTYHISFKLQPEQSFVIHTSFYEGSSIFEEHDFNFLYETYDFETGEPLDVPVYLLDTYGLTDFDNTGFNYNAATHRLTIKNDVHLELDTWGSSFNDIINKFVQLADPTSASQFHGIFKYNGTNEVYDLADTQLNANSSVVYNSYFYGANGVDVGTLFTNSSNLFNDLDAEIVHEQLKKYAELPIQSINTVDEFNNLYPNNLHFIPTDYKGNSLIDTSNMNTMCRMFSNYPYITNIPNLNTTSVTNMANMFTDCSNLRALPENLKTNLVTNFSKFIINCYNLNEVPNSWNAKNATNISFEGSGIINAPNWNLSNLTSRFDSLFNNCINLTDASKIKLPNISNISDFGCRYMFNGCENLSVFPTMKITNSTINGYMMFENCRNLQNLSFITLDDPIKISQATYMFRDCKNLPTIGNVNVTQQGYDMFRNCYNLQNVGQINYLGNNCANMFELCVNLTDVKGITFGSSLKNTVNMFADCRNLQNVTINGSTPSVNTINGMFARCNNLSNASVLNIIKWVNTLTISQFLAVQRNLMVNNYCSPFYMTKFDNSYYSSYML